MDNHSDSSTITIDVSVDRNDQDVYFYSDGAYEVEKADGNIMEHYEMAKFLCDNRNNNNSELKLLYDYLLKIGNLKNLDDDFTIVKMSI